MKTPPPDARWIWVSLPRATFGLIVMDGRVVDAAPYGRLVVLCDYAGKCLLEARFD